VACRFRILGLGGFTYADKKGTFKGKGIRPDGSWGDVILKDVLYAPDSPCKLFSWKVAKKRRAWIDLNGSPGRLSLSNDHSSAIAIFDDSEGYPVLKLVSHEVYSRDPARYPSATVPSTQVLAASTSAAGDATSSSSSSSTAGSSLSSSCVTIDVNQFHHLHGHASLPLLQRIASTSGIRLSGTLDPCEVCATSQFKRKKIAKVTHTRATKFLSRIFVDLTGPMIPSFESGVRYYMVIVDDYTRYKWVYGLRDKSAIYTSKALAHFLSRHRGVEYVRMDNGTEWKNELIQTLFVANHIIPEFIPPYSPQFNGVAEAAITHIRTVALSLLNQAQCDGKLRGLWFEAVRHATRLLNDWPCASNPAKQSPNQRRNLTDLRPLFVFGSKSYVENVNRTKKTWDNAAYLGLYVGSAPDSSDDNLRIFSPTTSRFIHARSVKTFDGQFISNPVVTGLRSTSGVQPLTDGKRDDAFNWFPVPSKPMSDTHSDDVFHYHMDGLDTESELLGFFESGMSRRSAADDDRITTPSTADDDTHYPADTSTVNANELPHTPVLQATRRLFENSITSSMLSTEEHPASSMPSTSSVPAQDDSTTATASNTRLQPRQILFHRDRGQESVVSDLCQDEASEVQVLVEPVSDLSDYEFDVSTDGSEFGCVFSAEELPSNLRYDDLVNAVREPDDILTMNALLATMIDEVTTTLGCELSDTALLSTSDPEVIISAMAALSHVADIAPSSAVCPKTYSEAKASPECAQWEAGMASEHASLVENQTWNLVDKPPGANVVGCRWVFQKKLGPNNEVIRYKCRLVAQGFRQREYVDYDTTYSPVVGLTTIRTLLAQAASENWPIYQMDVVTAFLQAPVDCDIYMAQAPGFIQKGSAEKVYKLNKAIYGLKQSPFLWNCAIHEWLVDYGFVANAVDRCLYVKVCPLTARRIIVTIYVDDLLITGDDTTGIGDFRTAIQKRFKMTDLGQIHHCLGFQVTRDASFLYLRQTSYIERVLERFAGFGIHGSDASVYKIKDSPAESGDMLKRFRESKSHAMVYPYRELIGSLMYLTTVSRPDIANVVRILSKFTNEYQSIHVKAAQRVLRYLAGTKHLGLRFKINSQDMNLIGYSDSSYADNVETARSTTGFALVLNGSAVVWKSRCQQTVARSTCEAEYMAMSQMQ